jgi:hypothetical protein
MFMHSASSENRSSLGMHKILLFELTEMTGDLVEGVLADDDVEFIRARGDFMSTVVRERPDIVVIQTSEGELSLRKLLDELPRVRLLALADAKQRAAVYDVESSSVPLTDASPRTLRGALNIGTGARR